MRRVILDSIISLDGYYTSLSNEIDWFGFNQSEIEWSKEILRRVDTMLYGRVTYQEFSDFWPEAVPTPDGFDSEIIGQLNGYQKIVFTGSEIETPWKPVKLIHRDPVSAVREMKNENGKDMVVVGSGTLVSSLVANDLVDEYRIRIRPIILGSGKPLFHGGNRRHNLRLISSAAFDNGVLAIHYEPLPP